MFGLSCVHDDEFVEPSDQAQHGCQAKTIEEPIEFITNTYFDHLVYISTSFLLILNLCVSPLDSRFSITLMPSEAVRTGLPCDWYYHLLFYRTALCKIILNTARCILSHTRSSMVVCVKRQETPLRLSRELTAMNSSRCGVMPRTQLWL